MNKKKKLPFDKDRYIAKLSEKGLTIDFSKDDIMNNLPHLASELLEPDESSVFSLNDYKDQVKYDSESQMEILENDEIQEDLSEFSAQEIKSQLQQRVKSKYSEDSELFYPKTEDFIRRCSTIDEAIEIIDHQLKMGEIDENKAEQLKKICSEKGIRFFGEKKEDNYYERKYRTS